jgi:hypothetical protein
VKNKKRFIVVVREVWHQPKQIEAESAAEALNLVGQGHGECIEGGFEYSHARPSDEWTVEEVPAVTALDDE